jgi:hypothetical protein
MQAGAKTKFGQDHDTFGIPGGVPVCVGNIKDVLHVIKNSTAPP